MSTENRELNMNDMENANGAGLFKWLVTHVAAPIASRFHEIDDNMDKAAEEFNKKYCRQD